jgi:hypothetical protein
VTDTEKDALPPATQEQANGQDTPPSGPPSTRRRWVSVLAGLALFILIGLVAIAVLDALINAETFARATPTPALVEGLEVRLVAPEYGPVTVWQVAGKCEPGLAFGQAPSGSEARVAQGYCYNRKQKSPYHLITLSSGSSGWVAAGNLVSAAEYIPPTPTETVVPTPGPTALPAPTALPTSTPIPAPLPPGSTLRAGNWEVRVDRVETVDAVHSAAGDQSVQASGRFALVYLALTNTGVQPAALHASRVLIQDAAGNEYRNNNTASAYASSPGCADFVLDLESGGAACLVAAIDIPAQGGVYALGLTGGTQWVLLDLP